MALEGTKNEFTSQNGINFYKACRIFFECIPEALRIACDEEHTKFPADFSLPDQPLKALDFSRLADHLVSPKRVPNKCGSFYFKGFSANCSLPDPKRPNRTHLLVIGNLNEELSEYKFTQETKACVNKELCSIERISEREFELRRSMPKTLKWPQQVFFLTEKCQDVYDLKTLRNEKIGHALRVSITDEELKDISFTTRKACCSLGAISIENRLEAIMKEIVAEEKVECLMKQFEANLLNVQQEVEELQQQVLFERKEREALEGKVDILAREGERCVNSLSERVVQLEQNQSSQTPPFLNIQVFQSQKGLQPIAPVMAGITGTSKSMPLAIQSSSRILQPGPPDEEEISCLAKQLSNHCTQKKFLAFCKILKMEAPTAMQVDSDQPLELQIRNTLNNWVENDPAGNDRVKLKELLIKGRFLSFTKCLKMSDN